MVGTPSKRGTEREGYSIYSSLFRGKEPASLTEQNTPEGETDTLGYQGYKVRFYKMLTLFHQEKMHLAHFLLGYIVICARCKLLQLVSKFKYVDYEEWKSLLCTFSSINSIKLALFVLITDLEANDLSWLDLHVGFSNRRDRIY